MKPSHFSNQNIFFVLKFGKYRRILNKFNWIETEYFALLNTKYRIRKIEQSLSISKIHHRRSHCGSAEYDIWRLSIKNNPLPPVFNWTFLKIFKYCFVPKMKVYTTDHWDIVNNTPPIGSPFTHGKQTLLELPLRHTCNAISIVAWQKEPVFEFLLKSNWAGKFA